MGDKKTVELLENMMVALGKVSEDISSINERIDRIEGKTNDIHSLVPFGKWFEGFSKSMARRISWFNTQEESTPLLTVDSSTPLLNVDEYMPLLNREVVSDDSESSGENAV